MSNCQTITTGTQTDLFTSTITTTTFSLTTSTPDPVTSTFTTTSCVASLGGICGSTTEIVETTTIPGTPTTISSPVTLTTQTTATSLRTLLGTRCTTDPDPRTSNPPSNNPTPQPNPTPTINTSASQTNTLLTSTGADGVVRTLTVTESAPASTSSSGSDAGVQNGDAGGGDKANIGAIVGGTLGGVVGIIGIILIIWFILKRRRRWDDIFDDDGTPGGDPFTAGIAKHHGKGNTSRFSLSQDLEDEPKGPKPYQYGLVGHVPSPSATSPPNSPPVRAAVGHQPVPPLQMPANGMYQPSLAASGPPTSTTLISSRPSTAGSMQPLTYPPPQSNHHSSRSASAYTHTTTPSITQPPLQHAHSYGFAQATPPQPQPLEFDPYASYPNHVLAPDRGATGSPMSVQFEPRKLQVTNQGDSVNLGASVSPPRGALAERSTSPTAGGGGLAYMD